MQGDLLTTAFAIFFFCLPWLLIWQLFRARRKVRALERRRLEESSGPVRSAYVDALAVDGDGLTAARPDTFDPALAAADRNTTASDDLKNLEGRR